VLPVAKTIRLCQNASAGYVVCEAMSPMPRRLLRGLAFLVIAASLPIPSPAEEESARRIGVSPRMRDAILAEFRKDVETTLATFEETPVEVERGVVVLPELKVRQSRDLEALVSANLNVPTEAIPLKLGTGITEVRGRKFTALTQRLFFIPIGFKLEW